MSLIGKDTSKFNICKNKINNILRNIACQIKIANIKEFICSRSQATYFFLASLFVMALPIFLIYTSVEFDRNHINESIINCIFLSISDALILLLPFWLINRHRWLTLIPIWLSGIFVEINLLMLKWNSDLISFHSIYMTGNVDNAVTDNIPMLLTPFNFIIIILLIAYTVYYYRKRKIINQHRYSIKTKVIAIISTILIFIVNQVVFQIYHYNSFMERGFTAVKITDVKPRIFHRDGSRAATFLYKGYPLYVTTSVYELLNSKSRDLSGEQLNQIDQYFLTQDSLVVSHPEFNNNKNKNLIIILVESLNSQAINATASNREVMPVLSSLTKQEGTISALNVLTQIKDGSSGDGQMLINTGLLPLNEGSSSIEYGSSTDFIALPMILEDRNSVAVFSESGNCWDKKNVYYNFGFNEIVTTADYSKTSIVDDAEVMKFSESLLSSIKQPFFLEVLTMSMHSPFDMIDEDVPEWISNSEYSSKRQKYYHACNYFDSALGKFIDRLKEFKLWDNTILVIVSDHSTPSDEDTRLYSDIEMAFLATNTGVTANIEYKVGQVDLFTTILDIMDNPQSKRSKFKINSIDRSWQGLGQSILSTNYPKGAVDPHGKKYGDFNAEITNRLNDAYTVSNNFIRGNYLKRLKE